MMGSFIENIQPPPTLSTTTTTTTTTTTISSNSINKIVEQHMKEETQQEEETILYQKQIIEFIERERDYRLQQVWEKYDYDDCDAVSYIVSYILSELADVGDEIFDPSNAAAAAAMPASSKAFYNQMGDKPTISILDYLKRLNQYIGCSKTCYIVALIYMDKLMARKNYPINKLSIHRMFFGCILVSTKFYDDYFYPVHIYSRVGGITPQDTNTMERRILEDLEFNILVSTAEFDRYMWSLDGRGLIESEIANQKADPESDEEGEEGEACLVVETEQEEMERREQQKLAKQMMEEQKIIKHQQQQVLIMQQQQQHQETQQQLWKHTANHNHNDGGHEVPSSSSSDILIGRFRTNKKRNSYHHSPSRRPTSLTTLPLDQHQYIIQQQQQHYLQPHQSFKLREKTRSASMSSRQSVIVGVPSLGGGSADSSPFQGAVNNNSSNTTTTTTTPDDILFRNMFPQQLYISPSLKNRYRSSSYSKIKLSE